MCIRDRVTLLLGYIFSNKENVTDKDIERITTKFLSHGSSSACVVSLKIHLCHPSIVIMLVFSVMIYKVCP